MFGRKKNTKVCDKKRKELLDLIYNKNTNITQASKITGIHYENAKAIVRVFETEGRICQKKSAGR